MDIPVVQGQGLIMNEFTNNLMEKLRKGVLLFFNITCL